MRVGIVAHHEDRVKTLINRENITESKAIDLIASRDEARTEFFSKFFEIDDPDRADLFHLTINTSEMELEFATDLIIDSLHGLNDGKIIGPITV